MKIGIITFHWATNYGAVLQSYALQTALENIGHVVKIINYKPKQYDRSFWNFIRCRHFLHWNSFKLEGKKERNIVSFRNRFLNLTKRFFSIKQLKNECNEFDILITGSDQVLNQHFLQRGEKGGSTAYYLDFGDENTKKIAYAASFGTTIFPEVLIKEVKPFVKKFNFSSSREVSGIEILTMMGASNPILVPDPTLLHTRDMYESLISGLPEPNYEIRAYFLRSRERHLISKLNKEHARLIKDMGIEDWLNSIKHSKKLITNSFHGAIFCLIFHVPFIVVLESSENIGMNDRFFTLLEPLGLKKLILTESEYLDNFSDVEINWNEIDKKIANIREIGYSFLLKSI